MPEAMESLILLIRALGISSTPISRRKSTFGFAIALFMIYLNNYIQDECICKKLPRF